MIVMHHFSLLDWFLRRFSKCVIRFISHSTDHVTSVWTEFRELLKKIQYLILSQLCMNFAELVSLLQAMDEMANGPGARFFVSTDK